MNPKKFTEAMSELDNKYVGEATNYKKKAKKPIWLKWGGIAACLAIAVAIGTLIPRQTTDPIPPNQGGEVMIETSYLNIYYVSENGIIENKSIEVRNTAEDIFNEWAALNNISDVSLVECIYDNGGTVTTSGDENDPEGVISHSNGNYFTLTIILSKEFSKYVESNNGELLIESLKETFTNYSRVDEFNLVIEDY